MCFILDKAFCIKQQANVTPLKFILRNKHYLSWSLRLGDSPGLDCEVGRGHGQCPSRLSCPCPGLDTRACLFPSLPSHLSSQVSLPQTTASLTPQGHEMQSRSFKLTHHGLCGLTTDHLPTPPALATLSHNALGHSGILTALNSHSLPQPCLLTYCSLSLTCPALCPLSPICLAKHCSAPGPITPSVVFSDASHPL